MRHGKKKKKKRKKRSMGECGVGAHLRWKTLSQFKRRGLLTHTVPLELAVQLSILKWAPSPTPRFTSWHSYNPVTGAQIKSAGTFCVSKVRLLLPTRCTDMVQILNPMTPLFWPMERVERVCLGSTRDRTSCQSLRAKFLSGNQTRSVHSEPRHTFSITGSLFYRSVGYHGLTCILTERGDTLIFFIFFLTLTRGICWTWLENDKQTHKGRLFCSLCENVPHTSRRSTDCIFFWTFWGPL